MCDTLDNYSLTMIHTAHDGEGVIVYTRRVRFNYDRVSRAYCLLQQQSYARYDAKHYGAVRRRELIGILTE